MKEPGEIGLQFPCICMSQSLARVIRDEETLTTCTTAAIKHGYYDDMLIVDSEGNAREICGAQVLHGVGRFGGFNVFLNRRVRVRVRFRGPAFHLPLEEVRRRVQESFQQWEGWSTRGDYDELKERVNAAQSISEVITLLSAESL